MARDPRSAVHGVLWDLALADVASLDRYEGLPQGLYAKLMQPVVPSGGRGRRSSISAPTPAGGGAPDYIAEIIAAARSLPLPAEAIEALERIAAAGGLTRGGKP